MKSLGSYTLGDQYVSPERRLSSMLTQQGSKGGPSNSWQETMGRIAQQLAGAYIGYKDTQNKNKAFDAQTGLEPDSKRPPTNAEAMASPGMRDLQLQSMTGIAGDGKGSTVTAPLPDDQLMQQGGIPGTLDKISRYNSGLSGDPINSAAYELDGDQNLTDGINLQAQNFQNEMEQRRAASNVPRPRDFKAELAQGMQGYQQDPNNRIVNQKMNPRDFSMQQLRGLENNPYAKRILAQMMMQNADRDYASGLAETQRGYADADYTRKRKDDVEDRDKRIGSTAPKSQEKFLANGLVQRQNYVGGEWVDDGVPYDKNLRSPESQEQAINRGQASKSFFDPEAYKKKAEIKETAKNESYISKPLPTTALKMQEDHIDAIGTAKGLDADLGKWDEMITSGKLDLGYFTNPLNYAKTYTGFGGDEQSRNYSSFRTSLEKMRNDSLRLNKGIQTEGDAQRIWKELIDGISDEEYVSQRLKELQAVNKRAVMLRKYQIDTIRNNYGKESMDETPTPTAIPGTGSKEKNFVYVPGQGIVPEKRGQQ